MPLKPGTTATTTHGPSPCENRRMNFMLDICVINCILPPLDVRLRHVTPVRGRRSTAAEC